MESTNLYKQRFDQVKGLSAGKFILGLLTSTIIMVASTWGVLSLLHFSGVYTSDPTRFIPYTMYMLAASVGSIVVAFFLVALLVKWPRTVSLPLSIHRRAKRHAGDYFLSPEPEDENLGVAFRRSLYGSVLVVGIALTILGFNLMAEVTTGDLIYVGTILMIVSVVILPFTIMLLYYGPWLMKDSGLFHIDERDRSLSNVGDDVEDILEFFAGVDIILVWLELTFSVGLDAPWLPIFIIIVPLGPLFAIVLNFTLVFMYFKKRGTLSMINYLETRYEVPDVVTSPEYIRDRVISLVDRELFAIVQATPEPIDSSIKTEIAEDEPEPVEEPGPEPEPDPGPESEPKGDHIPPPPGD